MQITTEALTTERISSAVEHLDARLMADGDYAYQADETGEWYRVTPEEMDELGAMLADPEQDDAYSLWCAGTGPSEISDLDHDTLDAIRDAGGTPTYRCQSGEWSRERCEGTTQDVGDLVHVHYVPLADQDSARASGMYARGACARDLYVLRACAEEMRYTRDEDGEPTEEEDPFVHVVGPAYMAAK